MLLLQLSVAVKKMLATRYFLRRTSYMFTVTCEMHERVSRTIKKNFMILRERFGLYWAA